MTKRTPTMVNYGTEFWAREHRLDSHDAYLLGYAVVLRYLLSLNRQKCHKAIQIIQILKTTFV